MSLDTLRFASSADACSYLSELVGGCRMIIGSITPKEGDMVVFYHPKEGKFYATKFPGVSAKHLKKGDIIAEFDDNANEEKIGQEMRTKFLTPWFHSRKSIKVDDIPNFIWANSINADQDLESGNVEFVLDEGSSSGAARSRGRFQKRNYGNFTNKKFTTEGNIKSFKKNPKRMLKKVKNKTDKEAYNEMSDKLTDVSKAQLEEIFGEKVAFDSVSDALQFLSDITESTIKIRK